MKKQSRYFFEECYMMNFYFYLGWEPKDIEKHLKKIGWNVDLDFMNLKGGYTVELYKDGGKKQAIMIWTKDYPNNPKSIAALAHECLHAVNFLFKSRVVFIDTSNDEPQAYMLALLMRKALGE